MSENLKTIAILGSTGGIGREVAFELARLGKKMIFVDRNIEKIEKLKSDIKNIYPNVSIRYVLNDLSSLKSIKNTAYILSNMDFDALVLNAGIYNVPKKILDSGYNNIFQVNFLSQYYLARKLVEAKKVKKIVVTGSIAYRFSKIKKDDIDFKTCKNQNKIYSNSKKFLMLATSNFTENKKINFSIANPGITMTSLTAHFPKWINWFVKFAMKIIFPSAKKASKNVISAIFNDCKSGSWVSPKFFDVWGKPIIKQYKFSFDESQFINKMANNMFLEIEKDNNLTM